MKPPFLPLLTFLLIALCPALHAAERVALVIGNNTYRHMAKLGNPQRDAQAVAEALKALKFDVESIQDATAESFYEGLEKLKIRAAGAELALVYFAGHGVEIGDKNYLLPVDAELTAQAQLRTQAVALDDLLADLEKTKVVAKVAILDCCRNDPLTRSWKTARSAGAGGLAELKDTQLPSSSLVMFSAGPGQVAADGAGGNSPFTGSLVKRLSTPGESILNAFFGTSDDVAKDTAKRQTPWVKFDGAGQVFRELVMVPGGGEAPAISLPGVAPITQDARTQNLEGSLLSEVKVDIVQRVFTVSPDFLKAVARSAKVGDEDDLHSTDYDDPFETNNRFKYGVKKALTSFGVTFSENSSVDYDPTESSAAYDPTKNTLTIRSTAANIKLIEDGIKRLK